jgi:hypothetical protein
VAGQSSPASELVAGGAHAASTITADDGETVTQPDGVPQHPVATQPAASDISQPVEQSATAGEPSVDVPEPDTVTPSTPAANTGPQETDAEAAALDPAPAVQLMIFPCVNISCVTAVHILFVVCARSPVMATCACISVILRTVWTWSVNLLVPFRPTGGVVL